MGMNMTIILISFNQHKTDLSRWKTTQLSSLFCKMIYRATHRTNSDCQCRFEISYGTNRNRQPIKQVLF